MKRRKTSIMLILFTIFVMSITSYGATISISNNTTKVTRITGNNIYYCDLNGDGYTDKIEARGTWPAQLYINNVDTGKKLYLRGEDNFVNINKNDAYVEICSYGDFYRYNGYSLVPYMTFGNSTGPCYILQAKGDNRVVCKGSVSGTGVNNRFKDTLLINFKLIYKMRDGKLKPVYNYSTPVIKAKKVKLLKNISLTKGIGKGTKFQIKKGRYVKATKVRYGKTYSYVKIMDVSTKKSGWLKIKTSDPYYMLT